MSFKIGILGYDKTCEHSFIDRVLKFIINKEKRKVEIITGDGGKSVDKYTEHFAKDNNIKLTVMESEWNLYIPTNRTASMLRDKKIMDRSNMIIIFDYKESIEMKHIIKYCEQIGKKYIIIPLDSKKKFLKNMSKIL